MKERVGWKLRALSVTVTNTTKKDTDSLELAIPYTGTNGAT